MSGIVHFIFSQTSFHLLPSNSVDLLLQLSQFTNEKTEAEREKGLVAVSAAVVGEKQQVGYVSSGWVWGHRGEHSDAALLCTPRQSTEIQGLCSSSRPLGVESGATICHCFVPPFFHSLIEHTCVENLDLARDWVRC